MMTKAVSRRKFLKQGMIAGGSLFLMPLGKLLANGFWEEHAGVKNAGDSSLWRLSQPVSVGHGVHVNYPAVTLFNNQVWVSVTEQNGEKEALRLYMFDDELNQKDDFTLSPDLQVNSQSVFCTAKDHLYVFWKRKAGNQCELVFQDITNFPDSSPGILAGLTGNSGWISTAADPEGRILVAWQDEIDKHYKCRYSMIINGVPNPVRIIPSHRHVLHPDTVWNRGKFYIAAEHYSPEDQSQIYITSILSDGTYDETIRITDHPAGSYHPSVTVISRKDLIIAYYSSRKGRQSWDMPRWIYMSLFDGRKVYNLQNLPGMDLCKEMTDQSLEYPKLTTLSSGQLFLTARPSQNFFIQLQGEEGFEKPYRLENEGWGGRGHFIKTAVTGNTVYIVRRDLRSVVLQKVLVREPEGRIKKIKKTPAVVSVPMLKNTSYEKYRDVYPKIMGQTVFFGDLHHHTAYSDGIGDPDEYFTRSRDLLGDDFFCLTDHDNFVGRPMQPGDWQMMKDVADYYNEDDLFATFYGIEWTTGRYPNSGYGHRNIYAINPAMPLIDHTREPWKTSRDLLREIRAFDGIAVPHHTGWTGTDWENADDISQPLCEIISNHGAFEFMGNRPVRHRGGIKGCFVQDGLVAGRKFGLIGSSDSHGLIWHHRAGYKRNCIRSGLTAIISEDLTRESLFHAMKKRHVYATSGIKLFLRFECENGIQGDVVEITNVPEFSIECISPDPVKRIVMVKNNVDVYEYGGDGHRSRFIWTDRNPIPGKESWYYLRIITQSGEIAWSSPLWITPMI